MVKGDWEVKSSTAIANNGTFILGKPTGSNVDIIRTIIHGGTCELYFYIKGAPAIKVDTFQGSGAEIGLKLQCNADHYYYVKNISGAGAYFGYAKVQVK